MKTAKTALITGSTSGIGKAIALSFAKKGMNIVLNGFGDQDDIENLLRQIESHGVSVFYSAADVGSPEQVESMINYALKKFGNIDILVNNAGLQFTAPVESFPVKKWDSMVSIMLSSAFYTSHYCLEQMKTTGWGRIINISSVHGQVASKYKAAYVASKHGLIGLSKVIALENAGTGITSNCICPGWVKTPLVEQQITKKATDNNQTFTEAQECLLGEKMPSKQFVELDDIAEICIFLCSSAAAQITGSTITVDGGWTAQ